MRIAVISDTHSNAIAFKEVIKDINCQSPDAIVCLGDIVMRGPQPAECVDLLHSLDALAIVRGNYEHMFTRFPPTPIWKPQNFKEGLKLRAYEYDMVRLSTEDQDWLANLPTEHVLNIEQTQIELFHASPDSLSKVTYPWASLDDLDKMHQNENTNVILYGHIHHAFVRQAMGRLVVNCGSVGLPFDRDNRASYAIVDIENGNIAVQLRRVSYDIEKVIKIAKDRSYPDIECFEYGVRKAIYPYFEEVKITGKQS
ncbi:metallophosphoesterase family protein [Paenibacillus filicis]|uniref:Phosphoesterase n=1 Tax=Paenibacillus filicis TaxID=669464 RepID=A0ABU9DW07_9BACL